MQNKMAHVATYLKRGLGVDVNIKLGKVDKSQTNPHRAYKLADVVEFVELLRHQPLDKLENEPASEKKNKSK